MYKANCLHCGVEFRKTANVQKFCSPACRKESNVRTGPVREVACKGCSTKFETTDARREFCEPACRYKFFNSRRFSSSRTAFRKCVVCTKEFQPLQKTGSGRSTCSDNCKKLLGHNPKWVAKHLAGEEQDAGKLERIKRWRHENQLKKTFGLSVEQFNAMLTKQNGVCAICEKPERAKSNARVEIRRLAVDHCHTTGKVRALLCSACNTALGGFKDDPELLRKAAAYIESHKEVE
jgi:hypothetical protein